MAILKVTQIVVCVLAIRSDTALCVHAFKFVKINPPPEYLAQAFSNNVLDVSYGDDTSAPAQVDLATDSRRHSVVYTYRTVDFRQLPSCQ